MEIYLNLATAKRHLRVDDDYQNVDINLKLEQATSMVLERCNTTAYWRAISATWTADTIPLGVQAAMLVTLTHLYEHRGDDPESAAAHWEAIDRLIGTNKDPVLA